MPIVEPEVLMDGDHTIERSFEVSSRTLHAVFTELRDQRVEPEGILLKPNMVLSGYACPEQASHDEVAEHTLRCFRRHVPAAVPGIVFLSGGQTDEDATANLNAINQRGPHPWEISLLLRARAAGAGAQGVERPRGQGRGRPAGVLPPGQAERRGAERELYGGDGTRDRRGLTTARVGCRVRYAAARRSGFSSSTARQAAHSVRSTSYGMPCCWRRKCTLTAS